MWKLFVSLTCINQTRVYSEKKVDPKEIYKFHCNRYLLTHEFIVYYTVHYVVDDIHESQDKLRSNNMKWLNDSISSN